MPDKIAINKIEAGVRLILEGIGEDPLRDGLLQTPHRVAEMLLEITSGAGEDITQQLKPLPGEDFTELVLVKDISIASICEHHLAPFTGKCHIAYIPSGGKLVGIAKLARLADIFARRLQVRERLTWQIAEALQVNLEPAGVYVAIEAEHTCMTMRGLKKAGAKTITTVVLGEFKTNPAARAEVMSLIKGD